MRSLMSTRCSGLASRSFIIGSRLWPPAMTRASGPSRCSAAMASSTLSARSYSNGAGVCTGRPFVTVARGLAAADAGLLAGLVLLRRVGADDGRALEPLGARLAGLGVQGARREAAAGDVAQDRAAGGAGGGDRRLAAEAGERQRALRVHLADPRRLRRRALGERAEAGRGGARVQAVDEADGVLHPGLLDEQPLEQVHARVEVLVDRVDDLLDGRALLD